MSVKIYYCCMCQNELSEVASQVSRVLPHVDKVIVSDNGSIDNTIFYMRNWASLEPKIEFCTYSWADNFSEARNNYLSKVPGNAWVAVSDCDEVYEEKLLQDIRDIIEYAEKNNKDMIGLQCKSVTMKGPVKVWENLDNYHKRLIFKKYPKTHYIGNPHESLAEHPHKIMDTKYIYEHIKQENIIWKRGFRNMFIQGSGKNLGSKNPHWTLLRQITASLGINTWHEMEKYMLKGNIDQRIKDEFIKYLSLKEIFPGETDGLSEHREAYKFYFRILHPEEEPESLKNILIP